MTDPRPSRDQSAVIRAILGETKRIAVVGASDDPEKPSYGVVATLVETGYDVVPVNPKATQVQRMHVAPSLADVTGPIDLVDVFRRPEHVPDVVREAIDAGARAVWVQLGIVSDEGRALADEAGIPYVDDVCLGATVRELRGSTPLPPRP
ncbi:CoA-binding protein [Nitriliruptoraceae bacterium ZYF776]|nr:CoA-binding protein [Profundirhabdus halotolerans]